MPNYRKIISERKMKTLHTHELIFNRKDGSKEVTKVEFLDGTIYGDSMTVAEYNGSLTFGNYWEGRCVYCERGGHTANVVCEDCNCEEFARNPEGLEKFDGLDAMLKCYACKGIAEMHTCMS